MRIGGDRVTASALPPGGTTGQMLNVASGGSYAWTSGPTFTAANVSGTWIDSRVGQSASTQRAFSFNYGNAYWAPFYIPAPVSITAMGIYYISSSGSTTIYYGLASASGGRPSSQIAAASVNSPAAGLQQTSVSASLPAGWYFAGVGNSATSTSGSVHGAYLGNCFTCGVSSITTGSLATVYVDAGYGGTINGGFSSTMAGLTGPSAAPILFLKLA